MAKEDGDVQKEVKSALIPMLQALVDKPEAVKVETLSTSNKTLVVNISVDKLDTGKIIGKSGRHADALRTLVKAIAASHSCRAVVEIGE